MDQALPAGAPSVSVVIPIYNEQDSIRPLWEEIRALMDSTGRRYEVLFVDDGSRDDSRDVLLDIAHDDRVRLILLRRNFGQTAAMHAGIQHADNDYIVTMDGDMQNDPDSIPLMLAKLDEGYDLVHGWRRHRQDKLVSRKLPSWLANRLISKATGFPIHDLGCTLKAIKSEVAKDIELYGEMHRFIPILANNLGARCVEVEVKHRARVAGVSKYGIGRSIRVLLDLITIQYMTKYFASPMKFFGMAGFIVGVLAIAASSTALVMKLGWGFDLTGNPFTFLSIVCAILSVQFFSIGLIGELSVRIYYSTGRKQSYQVRRLVNFPMEAESVPSPSGSAPVLRSVEAVR